MNYEDWCADKLAKLLNEDLRISTLNEIKEHFNDVPQNEAINIAETLQLPLVFDCLNNSNNEQIDLACEVLTLCMTNLNLGESTSRYSTALERALNHPNSAVKLMALTEISREVVSEHLLLDLSQRHSLLINIINCIGDEDLAVATVALKIITALGKMPVVIKQLLTEPVLSAINDNLSMNDVVRLRFYEMFVEISTGSKLSQNMLISIGFLPRILRETENDDILLKLNIIEILSKLITSKHGYEYLEEQGTPQKLFNAFNIDDVLFIKICEPGILKFFGSMAFWKPLEVFSKYSTVIDRLFENISSDEYSLFGVSLDTIGHIGETMEGKSALNTLGNRFSQVLSTIWSRISVLPTEFQVRSLNCISNILKSVNGLNQQGEIITQNWYKSLSDNPMDRLMFIINNPFGDIRSAGLGVLKSIGEHMWGHETIRNTPGCVEFLLNRNVESVKECKEVKYEIVQLLANSPAFDKRSLNRFEIFIREGAFYVHPIVEIEVEGN